MKDISSGLVGKVFSANSKLMLLAIMAISPGFNATASVHKKGGFAYCDSFVHHCDVDGCR